MFGQLILNIYLRRLFTKVWYFTLNFLSDKPSFTSVQKYGFHTGIKYPNLSVFSLCSALTRLLLLRAPRLSDTCVFRNSTIPSGAAVLSVARFRTGEEIFSRLKQCCWEETTASIFNRQFPKLLVGRSRSIQFFSYMQGKWKTNERHSSTLHRFLLPPVILWGQLWKTTLRERQSATTFYASCTYVASEKFLLVGGLGVEYYRMATAKYRSCCVRPFRGTAQKDEFYRSKPRTLDKLWQRIRDLFFPPTEGKIVASVFARLQQSVKNSCDICWNLTTNWLQAGTINVSV